MLWNKNNDNQFIQYIVSIFCSTYSQFEEEVSSCKRGKDCWWFQRVAKVWNDQNENKESENQIK